MTMLEQLRPSHWLCWLIPPHSPGSIHQPAVCWTLPLRNPATDARFGVIQLIGSMRSSRMEALQLKWDQNKSAIQFLWWMYHQTVNQISFWYFFPLEWQKIAVPWRLDNFEGLNHRIKPRNLRRQKLLTRERALKTSCRLECGPNRCRFRFWNVYICSNTIWF